MLWEVEIQTKDHDSERDRVRDAYDLLAHTREGAAMVTRSARGYLLQGELGRKGVERLASLLLVDSLVETGRIENLDVKDPHKARRDHVTVLLKPGVMDPAAMSVLEAARELGVEVDS
ncbi:MAG TPA: phosphoribosylformylglycinamidine synthase, partial [Gemmataceae bacterium]|nr:phosphoribosylformylglycinamidine synthase [Gemmataceae bacterium]